MASTEPSISERNVEEPWHAAFPTPKATASSVFRAHLLSWLKKDKRSGKDFVLVDLRRTDYEGGTIHGSINLPAQSLHPSIPTLHKLFSSAGITIVIWYCSSSRGRGNRAAGWFADFLKEQNDTVMESCVLEGGIKGWATSGKEYVDLMDDYEGSAWQ